MNEGLFGKIDTEKARSSTMGRRDHLTFRGNVAVGRHGWLRLTPAYSLGLVRELLKTSGPDELVLEPFSGTGTTALACAAMGIRCDAVDINPFLVWLGNLKLTPFAGGINDAVKDAAAEVAILAADPETIGWKPDLHQIEKWWDAATLHVLSALFDGIKRIGGTTKPGVTDLLKVAFCRVMIQSANVSFGHQSMSFKKNADVEGLIVETPIQCTSRLVNLFRLAAGEVADHLAIDPPNATAKVFLGDSRNLPQVLPLRGYTAVITSPPYPNRMSYIRELRPYMYWLGFLSDGRAAGELDWQAIGGTWGCATSMLNTWKPNGHGDIPFAEFNRIVREIGAGHALLGRYVHKYFEDIKGHIVGLSNVLASGARCHYIVGNSKFYDTMLPVEEIYAALFRDAGFVGVKVETIRKRTSKKELFEFIVHANYPS